MIMDFGEIYQKTAKMFYGTGISKYGIIRNVHNKIVQTVASNEISVFGYKMFIDDEHKADYGIMNIEKNKEFQLMKKSIKNGDTVIDIGANVGFYTLFFRSLVGEKGKIISFEPEPNNFSMLKKNIEINNFENIEIFQYALGSEEKKISMKLSESVGQHTVDIDGDLEVRCMKLDDIVEKADFIKIDAEGYEVEILNGMKEILKKDIKLFVEFYYKLLKKNNSPGELLDILLDNNFDIFDARDNLLKIDDKTKFLNQFSENSPATDIFAKKNNQN